MLRIDNKMIKDKIKNIINFVLSSDLFIIKNPLGYYPIWQQSIFWNIYH